MKKLLTRIASIALLTAFALSAQGPGRDNGLGTGGGTATQNPPTVATIVGRQVGFLTTLLTLSTSQATQATTIFTAALTSVDALQTQIATAQTALAAAIRSNATATINTQSASIGTLEGQIVALNANADAAFYQLLTPAQQTTLNNLGAAFFGQGLGDIHIPGGGH